MKPRTRCRGRGFFRALAWLLPLLLLGGVRAQAQQPAQIAAGAIQISDVRSPPTPPVAGVGVVYLSITNRGAKPDNLIRVTTPVAAKVEIHRTSMAQGLMQMRQVATLECPPGATIKAEPGALHIMLVGLKQPLVAGTTFPVSMTFRDAGVLVVQVRVEALD